MKCGIVGAGLGGLLAGLSLLKEGNDVTIFEKLKYPGGRFANIEKRGYQLSTGALHMIPHGEKGPLGQMLKSLGVKVEIRASAPQAKFRINGKDLEFNEFLSAFPLREKVKITAMLAKLGIASGREESARTWINSWTQNTLALQAADSFCGWALSMDSSQLSSKEFMTIAKNTFRLKGPGIPVGGCGAVTGALVKEFERGGGKIYCSTGVKRIEVSGGAVKGIETERGKQSFDVVVNNSGPKDALALCGEENFSADYVKSVKNLKEAAGIKISLACSKPMLGHSGILFTPQAQRIHGLNEVTNADPSLAPKGMHLLMSHQMLDAGKNLKDEIELGMKDLRSLFPDFDKHCKVLAVQTYKNNWPVNRCLSGKHISPETPIKGLYNVGDAVKPEGWMETDGVAKGVELLLSRIR